jgi:hypothetical protein
MRCIALALFLGACSVAPRRDAGRHALVAQRRPAIEARVIELLDGSRWKREVRIELDPELDWCLAYTRDWGRKIVLGPRAFASDLELDMTLAHELTHAHMTGEWRELPDVVQEGVACWVSLVVVGRERELAEPEPELLRRVLTLSAAEYGGLADRDDVDLAATWLASRLFRWSVNTVPVPCAKVSLRCECGGQGACCVRSPP